MTLGEFRDNTNETPDETRVQTISRKADNPSSWKFEDVEIMPWDSGLVIFPWTQDAAARAVVHDEKIRLEVVRQNELRQLQALAQKYGMAVVPRTNPRIVWPETDTQVMVPVRSR
jgi:hypothetical protein